MLSLRSKNIEENNGQLRHEIHVLDYVVLLKHTTTSFRSVHIFFISVFHHHRKIPMIVMKMSMGRNDGMKRRRKKKK